MRALVSGAGGFIGSHLVEYLKAKGYWVRGVDRKYPEFSDSAADEFLLLDLTYPLAATEALEGGFDEVYALAAEMGGMGYISQQGAYILHQNALINLHTIEAARHAKVGRYLYTSSACVYPGFKQTTLDAAPLKESDAFPAWPDTEYGWEKLYAEQVALAYARQYGMTVRIPRFHNVYGPQGTWQGGREKAPAALCRKIAEAKRQSPHFGWTSANAFSPDAQWTEMRKEPLKIEVWGDGTAMRSFLYIDDCLEGLYRLMHSHYAAPLNIGSDRAISINDLAYAIARIAQVDIDLVHVEGPVGVQGRNSDNTLCKAVLDWEPQRSLDGGLELTYRWIEEQVRHALSE
jgi:nucleoside-diphosphate-sugar epimerase